MQSFTYKELLTAIINKANQLPSDPTKKISHIISITFGDYQFGPNFNDNYFIHCKGPYYKHSKVKQDLLNFAGEDQYEDGIFGALKYVGDHVDDPNIELDSYPEEYLSLEEIMTPEYLANNIAYHRGLELFNIILNKAQLAANNKATIGHLIKFKNAAQDLLKSIP